LSLRHIEYHRCDLAATALDNRTSHIPSQREKERSVGANLKKIRVALCVAGAIDVSPPSAAA